MEFSFGKYKGTPVYIIPEIDCSYTAWLLRQPFFKQAYFKEYGELTRASESYVTRTIDVTLEAVLSSIVDVLYIELSIEADFVNLKG